MDMAESFMDSIQLKRMELVQQYEQAYEQMMFYRNETSRFKQLIAEIDTYINHSVDKATMTEITQLNTS